MRQARSNSRSVFWPNLLPMAVLGLLWLAGAAQANTTYTIVSNKGVSWTQTVTLPEFPPDSKLLLHLQIINNGDPWDRAGRVWVQTPAGKVDLMPFITGFGGTYWNDALDISTLRPFLMGSVQFGGTVDQATGWKMTMTIEEVPAGNTSKRTIWAAKSIGSGTVWTDGQGDAGPKGYGLTIPNWPAQLFSKVYLTFFADGHGGSSGTGCCEFHSGTFQLWADGTTVLTSDPWRNASDALRSRNPTSGRWDNNGDGDTTDPYPTDTWSSDFARSGWLPGDYVHPYVLDITSALGALPGSHTISYDYLDNIGTAGGYWVLSSYVSATLSSAAPLATAVTLTPSANPSGIGNNVTLTAAVQFNSGTVGNAIGTMVFKDGTTRLSTNTVSAGVAAFTTAALSFGTHTLTAEYSGMPWFYQASTSAPLSQIVQATTTTTASLSASPNPSAVGSNLTLTAVVQTNGVPASSLGGTMVFRVDGTALRTNTVSGGVAMFTTNTLAYGSHLIKAEYSGYTTYLGSTSAPLAQIVLNPTATTTVLAAAPSPSAVGSNVTLTATVQTSSGPPAAGFMIFKDGTTALTTNTVTSGVATFSTNGLAYGSHLMKAEYSGYGAYLGSTSAPATQIVQTPVATSTTLTSAPNPAVADSEITFTATVTPSWGAGSVVFRQDGDAGSTNTVSGGVATFTTSDLSLGSYLMTAEYSGYGIFLASTSAPLAQVVRPPIPTAPTVLTWSLSGGTLLLSWPPDYLGWILQLQTNAQGLGTNWTDMAESAGVTSTNLPLAPENPAVYYRLRRP